MVDVGSLRIGLRIARAALGGVVAANTASTLLRQIDIVGEKDGEGVGLDTFCRQYVRNLRIEVIDVNQPGGKTKRRTRRSIGRWNVQRPLCQHRGDTQEQMRVLMRAHRPPEVCPLVGVNVLGRADIDGAEFVIGAVSKQRRLQGIRRNRLPIADKKALAQRALQLFRDGDDFTGLIDSLDFLGDTQFDAGKLPQALLAYKEFLKLSQKAVKRDPEVGRVGAALVVSAIVGVAVDEHDDVRILFYGPGFPQVRQHRALVGALLDGAREL